MLHFNHISGKHNGNIDVNMGMVGDLGTNSLKWIRRIIAAFIASSSGQHENNLKIGVMEFDRNTYGDLINFGLHQDYTVLLNIFQNENVMRMGYPRTDVTLQYIINSLTQNPSSNILKAGILVLDDASFSNYVSSGLAYQAYVNGIYTLLMRVNQTSSTLTVYEMNELANGMTDNTYTVGEVAKLQTDGLVWVIKRLHSRKLF